MYILYRHDSGIDGTIVVDGNEAVNTAIARMMDAGLLPDLPWLDWLAVAPGHPISTLDARRVSVGNWADPDSVTVSAPSGDDLRAYAQSRRRAIVAQGTTVTVAATVIPVWADPDTQAALTGLVVAVGLNPALATAWRGRDGVFYPLDAAGIVSLATGVMMFVQATFATEAAAVDGIASGGITSTAQIDALAWPS